jgi:hypothetical protein
LHALQQISPNTAQPVSGVGAGADGVSSAAAEQHSISATRLFNITPQMCIIPAGGQQQFMVSFCSGEARAVKQLMLQGRQSFCQPSVAEVQQECGLKLYLLPSQLASSSDGPDAATAMPVKCCITGKLVALRFSQLNKLQQTTTFWLLRILTCQSKPLHFHFWIVPEPSGCTSWQIQSSPATALPLPLHVHMSGCRRVPTSCRAATQADASPYSSSVCCGSGASADCI